ncbi:N-acetyl-gamma-glutamyl-phosphate reductase [Fulvivirga sedimenti]|uniref:N-acetyl-gamma-glutamyl-phosphate reductase n=1 Tax=Fulvivirga sedimenti TaxID=2879465 RepID=A0A9X1KYI8_9BACT|nr:N-acetyl-gamma-glutamyl-phosphate reductase [Fulvivirga sedimenti]MCA6075242.1 N-acetyl-gamma-glutamyl-phosphate reductase [Fulvivirga sedimenti]MCA6076419.1 N-acetyl-gamma-glutamyl-phosphate reductase [Fulvivirga sedimenti]MCA6077547.1 N-acetyl-gamma-glutamyl-phosphate reductase [Fulvivirga sedimenti]
MTDSTIKAAVIGAAGYTGGELIRLLQYHPNTIITSAVSESQAGKRVSTVHGDITGDMIFSAEIDQDADVVFLCMGHGKSREWLQNNKVSGKVIDLSQDFRLKATAGDFVYGLPEINKAEIAAASYIANPGCFATAIQLALLPLASENLVKSAIHINGITGSTGAGQSLSPTSHFSWRNNNISLYKVFDHQHLNEIGETLEGLQGDLPELLFVPVRGNFTRGIFITAYTEYDGTQSDITDLYNNFYQGAPFTHVSSGEIHLKQVVNTNNCMINVTVKKGQVLVTSAIDNLLKGASGQAVQNMNLMFGLDESSGLNLKASYF